MQLNLLYNVPFERYMVNFKGVVSFCAVFSLHEIRNRDIAYPLHAFLLSGADLHLKVDLQMTTKCLFHLCTLLL